MGKNKLAKFADMEEFPHVFQVSSHALREGQQFEMKGQWNKQFFKNDNPIVLELGCGKGEYTVGLAQLFPDKNFIGVDIMSFCLIVLLFKNKRKNRSKNLKLSSCNVQCFS